MVTVRLEIEACSNNILNYIQRPNKLMKFKLGIGDANPISAFNIKKETKVSEPALTGAQKRGTGFFFFFFFFFLYLWNWVTFIF